LLLCERGGVKDVRLLCCVCGADCRVESVKIMVDDMKIRKTSEAEMRQELKQAKRAIKDLHDQRETMLNAMKDAMEDSDNLKNDNTLLRNTNASLLQEKNQAMRM
jgi:hypothetical protein